jgi:hypothetical protein
MIGDRKSEFKLKIKGKSEEKVRGYDARDVSLSHPRDCKPSLLLTRKLGLESPTYVSAHTQDDFFLRLACRSGRRYAIASGGLP